MIQHLEKHWRTIRNLVLLTILIAGCSTSGEVVFVRSLCKYMTPFSFSIQSSGKTKRLSWFESNLNFLYLLRVPACLEFPMV